MSYQANPMQDQYIKNRIRDILHEKIADRTYKGSQIVGGQSVGGARRRTRRKYRAKPHRSLVNMQQLPLMHPLNYMGGYRTARAKNPNKVISGRQGAAHNPWIQFYREWSRQNAARLVGLSGRERAQMAADDYHKYQSGF